MRYYWVFGNDQRYINWILFRQTADGDIVLRDRYQDLICSSCKKLHEIEAITRGIDPDVTVLASTDILRSADGLILFSARAVKVVEDNRIKGLSFVSLPGEEYAVALPTMQVPTDAKKSGVEFYHKCLRCGRYGETCLSPSLDSMSLSYDSLTILTSDIPLEKMKTAKTMLLVPQDVMNVFKEAKLSGITYVRAQ